MTAFLGKYNSCELGLSNWCERSTLLLKLLSSRLRKLILLAWAASYRRALLYGVGAAVEHQWLLRRLNCKTVIDVGANRGQFALVARQCFPGAQIIAFEPLSGPGRLFKKLFIADRGVRLFEIALGRNSTEVVVHVAEEDDSSSLLPIGELQVKLFRTTETRIANARSERLDSVIDVSEINRPALLKIDVQGYEMAVLEGCGELLRAFDYIYVECSFVELYVGQPVAHEVIAFLNQRNVRLRGVFNVSYDKNELSVQADFLFTP